MNNLFKHTLGGFMSTYPFYSMAISTCPKYYIATQFKLFNYTYYFNGSKLFLSVKYTFHSIYSNTTSSTKQKLQNNLFKHSLGGFMSTYPFYSSMAISHLSKILCCNMKIQNIQLHILFQWDQNYFLQSNILFTQYILTPVHPLNTSYQIFI